MKRERSFTRVLCMMLALLLICSGTIPVTAAETKTVTSATCDQNATEYKIYPIPQNIVYSDGSFSLENEVAIVKDDQVDQYTMSYLKEILDAYDVSYEVADTVQSGKTNVLLGVQGNDQSAVAQYVSAQGITLSKTDLYEQNDAYMMDVSEDAIVIIGKNTDSVYYGVATLKMMFSSFAGEKFLNAHVEDYATVATRGYIEGFYGSWDFEEREALMRFARDYKMNSYVYAAKGDAYHTTKWDQVYKDTETDKTLSNLKHLVQVGEETKVKFAWSIHLGNFFKTFTDTSDAKYETQYQKLMDKLTQMVDEVGVKRIDVLNDDFGGGSHETVAAVLNRINADLKAKGCESITYCPQGYNKAWSKWSSNATELSTLKANLDSDIHIYWTGDDVNTPITQDTVNYVTEQSGHMPDFWLNYPVNEHAKSGIFLGDITYYARDGVSGLAGFHSNPSRYAYANEVGLYQLAALTWNNNNYSEHAQEIWESAFDYLQPEVKDSYFKIASNISNAPNSSRVPGFNESEYLKDKIAAVESAVAAGNSVKNLEEAQFLVNEFADILSAIADFRANCANKDLVSELDPWLDSLNDLATAGKAVIESLIALEEDNASVGWEKLSEASKAYDSAYTHRLPASDLDGVAKAGTKRLSPFIQKMINEANNKLSPILNPNDTTVSPVLYAQLAGTVRAADDNGKKMYDGSTETCAIWNSVQQTGDYFGLDLGRVVPVNDIKIVQGSNDTDHDIFHKARLEYSENGSEWTTVDGCDYSDGNSDIYTISVDGLNFRARYVRLYLVASGTATKDDYWTHVREFTVNAPKTEYDRVYTNIDTVKETPLTFDGSTISIRNIEDLTLDVNDYIGFKLVEPVTVVSFTKKITASGLSLEYSYNGSKWITATRIKEPVAVKYLRLVNKRKTSITTDIKKIGVTVKYLQAEPAFLSATTAGLAEGSYGNLFDQDMSTYVLTSGSQVNNTAMVFDLGKTVEVHDVTAVTTDGEERFYNAKIQISEDNNTWVDVASVENDNSVFEVPYRYVRGNAKGVNARYLRILFTGNNSNPLKLYELQINNNVEANQNTKQVVSNMSGNIEALKDNNITTLFAGTASAGSYIEYRITENTNVDQISVLQGNGSKGKVYLVTDSGKTYAGLLDKSVSVFDTSKYANVYAVRLEWEETDTVAVHEISLTCGSSESDDIGVYVTPIVISSGELPFTNIASLGTVTVSGTSDGNKDNVNDNNTSTKWDSNAIKDGSGADTGDAWLCLDFGTEKTYEFNKIVVSFHNKIYPTSWIIQTSEDGSTWVDVTETLTKANDGPVHPIETITFDPVVSGRYVRLYFNTVNTAAAGHGVGVKEVELYGREVVQYNPVEPEPDEILFTDLDENGFYYDAVFWAIDDNITKGVTNTTFCPMDSCTRAQVVMFLYKNAGAPDVDLSGPNPFSDVTTGGTFYKAIMWAKQNNITVGYRDGTFRPLDKVSRGEYIAFQYRAAGEPKVSIENPFSDVDTNYSFYNAIMWAAKNEITLGQNGRFMAADDCSRGHVVTFLYRSNLLSD